MLQGIDRDNLGKTRPNVYFRIEPESRTSFNIFEFGKLIRHPDKSPQHTVRKESRHHNRSLFEGMSSQIYQITDKQVTDKHFEG